MKNKKWFLTGGVVIMVVVAIILLSRRGHENRPSESVTATMGSIRTVVSATGSVEPQNRLEIKPPIGGRIEKILVAEGQQVHKGQTLLYMSSIDRAALLDAARAQGKDSEAYWSEVYKTTPIISQIGGTVIVKAVEPGQTVAAGDTVIVLSDRLIVQAQIDETDIGKIHLGQKTVLSLDAYPNIRVASVVDHIAYESKVVNNVTIYQVDILPREVPPMFRSGMSANVEVITAEKESIVLLPVDAIRQKYNRTTVIVQKQPAGKPIEQDVQTGLSDGKMTEIVSGLKAGDTVFVEQPDYSALKENKSNPFMPKRGSSQGRRTPSH